MARLIKIPHESLGEWDIRNKEIGDALFLISKGRCEYNGPAIKVIFKIKKTFLFFTYHETIQKYFFVDYGKPEGSYNNDWPKPSTGPSNYNYVTEIYHGDFNLNDRIQKIYKDYNDNIAYAKKIEDILNENLTSL